MTNEALKAIAANHNVAEDQIPAILNALSIKTESPSKVQLKGFERVCELVKGGKPLKEAAQIVTEEAMNKATAKDNPEPVQKPTVAEREHQLKEIAFRYSIPESDLPQILTEMQYKLETLTDAQVDEFQTLCQQLQNGMSLEIAVQSALNNAKTETKSKATGKAKKNPQPAQDAAAEQQPSVESSPASDKGAALAPRQDSPQPGLAMQAIPTGHGETLQSVVDIAVDTAGFDVNGRIATKALDAAQALDGAIDEAIWRSLTDPSRANALSAEKVVEAINREREQRHGR